jgi:hypothetical protein
MSETDFARRRIQFLDKNLVRDIVRQQNARDGFVPDPDATGVQSQEMMRSLGVRPEDNIGSCGIIAARDAI